MDDAGRAGQFEFVWTEPIVSPPREKTASRRERWEAFHQANPHVYRYLVLRAREVLARGRKVGIRLLLERLRWDVTISTASDDAYKINNDYSAFYAREIMEREPDLSGFFETRERQHA